MERRCRVFSLGRAPRVYVNSCELLYIVYTSTLNLLRQHIRVVEVSEASFTSSGLLSQRQYYHMATHPNLGLATERRLRVLGSHFQTRSSSLASSGAVLDLPAITRLLDHDNHDMRRAAKELCKNKVYPADPKRMTMPLDPPSPPLSSPTAFRELAFPAAGRDHPKTPRLCRYAFRSTT